MFGGLICKFDVFIVRGEKGRVRVLVISRIRICERERDAQVCPRAEIVCGFGNLYIIVGSKRTVHYLHGNGAIRVNSPTKR